MGPVLAMKEVLILLVARKIGGLERRFATLFKHCASHRFQYKLVFVVSRALADKLPAKFRITKNESVSLIIFGLPSLAFDLSGKLGVFARVIDYIALAALLLTRFRKRRFHAVHFVTYSSLFFRRLLKAKIKVASFVYASKKLVCPRSFLRALSEDFHVDNLSPQLKNNVLSSGLTDASRQHVAPCSFIDYGITKVGEKRPIAMFIGRFIPEHGVELLTEALPAMLEKCHNLSVSIVGYGPMEGFIRKVIEEEGLTKRVWLGFHEEPLTLLRQSTIFMSLKLFENYPSQSLLEAMASANAVVATDVGLTRKLVDDEVGILIRPNKNELVKAVCRLYRDPDKAMALGRCARERVLKEHTVERYMEYLEKIYAVRGLI